MEKDAGQTGPETGLKLKKSGEMGVPLHLPSPSVPTVQNAVE